MLDDAGAARAVVAVNVLLEEVAIAGMYWDTVLGSPRVAWLHRWCDVVVGTDVSKWVPAAMHAHGCLMPMVGSVDWRSTFQWD